VQRFQKGYAMKLNPFSLTLALAGIVALATTGIAGEATAPPARKAATAEKLYTCKMHPQIQWSRGDECPLCGMQLVQANRNEGAAKAQSADHGAMTMPQHDNMPMDHGGHHSAMGGCGTCMQRMGMGNTNHGSAPAGRKAAGSYGGGRATGSRHCGC
jgi:hypothetical protein